MTIPSKPTFLQVLHNQTCYPYSQESFAAFLERTKSLENLEFWLAVRHYKFYCFTFFSKLTQMRVIDNGINTEFDMALEDVNYPMTLSNNMQFRFNASEESCLPLSEATHFSLLKEKLYALLKTFILPGADKEINIPQKVRTQLLRQVTVQNNFHPAILRPARDLTFNMMRESSYTTWLNEVSSNMSRLTKVLLQGSTQSVDSGISSMHSSGGGGSFDQDDSDDGGGQSTPSTQSIHSARSTYSARFLEYSFAKHVVRIKDSLSPLTRSLKNLAVPRHQRSDLTSKVNIT